MSQDLETVAQQFQRWRDVRPKGSHTPHELADAAAGLVEFHSKSTVAERLGVNSKTLNHWVDRLQASNDFIALNEAPTVDLDVGQINLKLTLSNQVTLKLRGDSDAMIKFLADLQQGGLM